MCTVDQVASNFGNFYIHVPTDENEDIVSKRPFEMLTVYDVKLNLVRHLTDCVQICSQ